MKKKTLYSLKFVKNFSSRTRRKQAHEIRPGQDCPKIFHLRRDRDKTSSKILYETETRPRVSVSFNEEIYSLFAYFLLKTSHPDQNETEMRLGRNQTNETRQGRDCPENFHLRRDGDETSSKI